MNPDAATTSPHAHLEDLALDAVCHMGAALDVLELHARHTSSAIVCVCRDLLSVYHAKADHAQAQELKGEELVGLLFDISQNLDHAIQVLDHLNGDEAEDPILYAVSYLLKAARRFAQEGIA